MRPEETSRSLAAARDKLAAWQTKLDAIEIALPRLDARQRVRVTELRDAARKTFDRLSGDVMRLESLERAWRKARIDTQIGSREVERQYRRLEEALARTVDY